MFASNSLRIKTLFVRKKIVSTFSLYDLPTRQLESHNSFANKQLQTLRQRFALTEKKALKLEVYICIESFNT